MSRPCPISKRRERDVDRARIGQIRAELNKTKADIATLHAALGHIQSGVLLLDQDMRVQFSNPALHRMFNALSPENIKDGKISYEEMIYRARAVYTVSPAELDEYVARRVAWVKSDDPAPVDQNLSNGRVIRCQCAVLPDGGRMITYSDVTDIVRSAQEFERLATTDGMTGIHNRRHFLTLADHEWSRSRRYGGALSLLMIDIDFFKSINDSFGHEVGDQVIIQLTKVACSCKRDSDVLARIGGEEFALLLMETNLQQAQLVAERLRNEVAANPAIAAPGRIPATVSIGVATANDAMTGIADLMKAADQALYDAKRSGRNRVTCCALPVNAVADNIPIAPVAPDQSEDAVADRAGRE